MVGEDLSGFRFLSVSRLLAFNGQDMDGNFKGIGFLSTKKESRNKYKENALLALYILLS